MNHKKEEEWIALPIESRFNLSFLNLQKNDKKRKQFKCNDIINNNDISIVTNYGKKQPIKKNKNKNISIISNVTNNGTIKEENKNNNNNVTKRWFDANYRITKNKNDWVYIDKIRHRYNKVFQTNITSRKLSEIIKNEIKINIKLKKKRIPKTNKMPRAYIGIQAIHKK